MPWAYIATFTGTVTVPSFLGAAVSSPANDSPGTLLVLWSGGSEGGPLTAFTYDIPAFFVSPSAPVAVQPAQVGQLNSTNAPAAAYADGQFFIFWRGAGGDVSIYGSTLAAVPANSMGASTQDAPMVTYLAPDNTLFMAYNNSGQNDYGLFFSIVSGLGSGSLSGGSSLPIGGAFNGYFSPSVAATPDGGVSMLWKGTAGDQRLFYASALLPASGLFLPPAIVQWNGSAVLTTDRPTLGCWVPSADGNGGPVLVAVYPSNGKLMYMEAAYVAEGLTWQTQAAVPLDVLLANAYGSGGLVKLSNPSAVCATSPMFSDTVFVVIRDVDNPDAMYLVRYTGPDAPLAG